ncbi:DinB family protein [Mucilaginibacter sp. PAMB04274]|uniref:DinB family protein n=1 Tax=Mucilaginibacter sp. PAMB04274 TaxID=3138568 RepID=UPI0031F67C4C
MMNQIEMLVKQTNDAYNWTNKLLNSVPYHKWKDTPKVMDSNICWQAGHILVGIYFHSIMVVIGHQMDVLQKIPLKDYADRFMDKSPEEAAENVNPEELYEQLLFMQQKSIQTLSALPESGLDNALEPSPTPHPIAHNKFEALDWNIKHTMWHCGQLGMLKRVVDERFDFGLKR